METADERFVKAQLEKVLKQTDDAANTSGHGKNSVVPDGVRGWSWGAFLLNFVWAIDNKVWVGTLSIIPYLGVVIMFILGFKGRELAWQSKHWESVEQFNKVQRNWSKWAVGTTGAFLVLAVIVLFAAGTWISGVLKQ